MPFFSIVIPVYNVAPYLRECLDSVRAQKFVNWEAVCVDDGSTDGSGDILDEYAARDRRFRVIHQKNAGVCAARQKAWDEARGEWVASVDSDDWIDDDFLLCFEKAIRGHSCDIVWTGLVVHGGGAIEEKQQRVPADVQGYARALLEERVWGGCVIRAFRRSFMEASRVRFPSAAIGFQEDLCFVARCLAHKPVLRYVEGCSYHYRQRHGSALRGGGYNGVEAVVEIQRDLEKSLHGLGVDDLLGVRRQWAKLVMCKHILELGIKRYVSTFPDVTDVGKRPISRIYKIAFRAINGSALLLAKLRGLS